MEPIAIATAVLGPMYVVGRGGLLVAADATVAFYGRWLFGNPAQVRGVLMESHVAPSRFETYQ
jgi:hypothetical protein